MPSSLAAADHILGERRFGVGDIGGDHRHFEACFLMAATSGGRSCLTRCGFDMSALADGEIDAVEAQLGRGLGQLLALHELQVLGEDRDLQFLPWRAAARLKSTAPPASRVLRGNLRFHHHSWIYHINHASISAQFPAGRGRSRRGIRRAARGPGDARRHRLAAGAARW